MQHFFYFSQVWEKVMEFITTKEDIENCMEACPFFERYLHKKIVLPKVFRILLTKYYYRNARDSSHWYNDLIDRFLKYRYICKSLNSTIEEVYQEAIFERWTKYRFCMLFPETFLNHFEGTHYNSATGKPKKNPFLGRTVEVLERSMGGPFGSMQDFRRTIMEILRKYGKEIHYFHIDLYEYEQKVQLVRLYRQIQEMMTSMPNLKNLTINYLGAGNISEQIIEESEQAQGLNQKMIMNPIPKLPNLELVSVAGVLPIPIFRQFILQNQQITGLEACYCHFEEVSGKLPNLVNLKLRICKMEAWNKFEKSVALHLQKFKLDISNSHQFEEEITWSRVFRTVEAKMDREMCTELHLTMPEPMDDDEKISILEDSHVYRLEMPKLQVFTIQTSDTKFCLDFLLSCSKSLKKITIVDKTQGRWDYIFRDNNPWVSALYFDDDAVGSRYGGYEGRQIIKFLEFEENMQNSNISRELPHLKTLVMHTNEGSVIYHEFHNGQLCLKQIKQD